MSQSATQHPAPANTTDAGGDPMGFSVTELQTRINKVERLLKSVMKPQMDYGLIPGCGDKPALLKPGAELLLSLFELAPELKIEMKDLGDGHRECTITVRLIHAPTGKFWGMGIGSCSTHEAKYRYRLGGRKCPSCGKEAIIKGREEYGGGWVCFAKKGGCGTKFKDNDSRITGAGDAGKVENDNIADVYNTVLKQAKKRALVDAALTATAASRYFTQDMDDFEALLDGIDLEGTEAAAKAAAEAAAKAAATQRAKPATQDVRAEQLAWLAKRGVGVGEIEAYFGATRAEWTDQHWARIRDIALAMHHEKLSFDDACKASQGSREPDPSSFESVVDLQKAVGDVARSIMPPEEAEKILASHGIKSLDLISKCKDIAKLGECLKSLQALQGPDAIGDALFGDAAVTNGGRAGAFA